MERPHVAGPASRAAGRRAARDGRRVLSPPARAKPKHFSRLVDLICGAFGCIGGQAPDRRGDNRRARFAHRRSAFLNPRRRRKPLPPWVRPTRHKEGRRAKRRPRAAQEGARDDPTARAQHLDAGGHGGVHLRGGDSSGGQAALARPGAELLDGGPPVAVCCLRVRRRLYRRGRRRIAVRERALRGGGRRRERTAPIAPRSHGGRRGPGRMRQPPQRGAHEVRRGPSGASGAAAGGAGAWARPARAARRGAALRRAPYRRRRSPGATGAESASGGAVLGCRAPHALTRGVSCVSAR